MSRAPFQVLVLPYRILENNRIIYVIFRLVSSSGGYWQGIGGGGEDNETPWQAAKRESMEEAGISPANEFMRLDSFAMIPVVEVCGFMWGEDVLVIPNYCFGVRLIDDEIRLSDEHTAYKWLDYDNARNLLHWEGNRNALWELNWRLTRMFPPEFSHG